MSQFTYFSISDGMFEPFHHRFISPRDHLLDLRREFERSLLWNLLFNPTPLLIPDIFLFISYGLHQHLRAAHRDPLLRTAFACGRVKVAPRDPRCGAFRDLLKRVRGTEKGRREIKGILPVTDADEIAKCLDSPGNAYQTGPDLTADISASFGARLADLLGESSTFAQELANLPADTNACQVISDFQQTADLRMFCLEKAPSLNPEETGVRRGDILTTIGAKCGIIDLETEEIDGSVDLLQRLSLAGKTLEQQRLVWKLCEWVCRIYQDNQAAGLDSHLSCPGLDDCTHVLLRGHEAAGSRTESIAAGESVRITARIPSLQALLKVPSRSLLDTCSGEGKAYWDSVGLWNKAEPDDKAKRADNAQKALTAYGKALTRVARKSEWPHRIVEVYLEVKKRPGVLGLSTAVCSAGFVATQFVTEDQLETVKGIWDQTKTIAAAAGTVVGTAIAWHCLKPRHNDGVPLDIFERASTQYPEVVVRTDLTTTGRGG